MIQILKSIKNKNGDEYDIKLLFDGNGRLHYESSCTCRWGSFDRFSQQHKKDKWMCRHMIKAYAEVVKLEPQKARGVLIKQGLMNKTHLRII